MDISDYDDKHVTFGGVFVTAQTAKAILVDFGEEGEKWIPLSQVHEDSEVFEKGDTGDLIISRWIAQQKELL